MEKPVIRHIESSASSLESAVTPSAAGDCAALLTDSLKQSLEQQHQRLAGAHAKASGDKVFVVDQVAASVAQNVGDRYREHLRRQFCLSHQANVLLSQIDLALIDAIGLITERALHPGKARAVRCCTQV